MRECDRLLRRARRPAVAGNDEFGVQALHLREPPQPVGGVHVVAVHERDAAVLDDVAGEQHAVGLDQHHHVAGRVSRAGIEQHETLASEVERETFPIGDVGWDHARVVVDPGRERFAPLIEPLIGSFVGGLLVLPVLAGTFLGDDHDAGAVVLERLQPVDVIGVVVADHDIADRLVGRRLDPLQQVPAQAGRAERIEHHDALRGHDETGIGGMALIVVAGNAGLADHVVDRLARHLLDRERPPQRRIGRRIVCRRVRDRRRGQQSERNQGRLARRRNQVISLQ